MDTNEHQLKSQARTVASDLGMSHDYEAEICWDRLTEGDRRLIWLTASGRDVYEVAADVSESPREVARRYRSLLVKLGLDDRRSLVLAGVTRTEQAPAASGLA